MADSLSMSSEGAARHFMRRMFRSAADSASLAGSIAEPRSAILGPIFCFAFGSQPTASGTNPGSWPQSAAPIDIPVADPWQVQRQCTSVHLAAGPWILQLWRAASRLFGAVSKGGETCAVSDLQGSARELPGAEQNARRWVCLLGVAGRPQTPAGDPI